MQTKTSHEIIITTFDSAMSQLIVLERDRLGVAKVGSLSVWTTCFTRRTIVVDCRIFFICVDRANLERIGRIYSGRLHTKGSNVTVPNATRSLEYIHLL
jgi:hypothetical protein